MSQMSEAPNDSEETRKLAQRHLSACEAIYAAATARNNIDIAAHVARSALSVAFNCVLDLGDDSSRETAILWNKRLRALFAEGAAGTEYLSRALKWADDKMLHMNMRHRSSIEAGTAENDDGC
jgi:hypothetical protein